LFGKIISPAKAAKSPPILRPHADRLVAILKAHQSALSHPIQWLALHTRRSKVWIILRTNAPRATMPQRNADPVQ
jgi:hypothetical protein